MAEKRMSTAEFDTFLKEAAIERGWFTETAEKAIERKTLEMAKELYNMGLTIEQIKRATKLPMETLTQLLHAGDSSFISKI